MTEPSPDHGACPPSASARRYLRDHVPRIYQRPDADGAEPLMTRWLTGLEEVADPIVTLLDCLPAQFDPTIGDRDVLRLLGAWIGLDSPDTLDRTELGQFVGRAAQGAHHRGTRAGLEHLLAAIYPAERFEVRDPGRTGIVPADAPPGAGTRPVVEIRVARHMSATRRAEVGALCRQAVPAHVDVRVTDGSTP